MTEDGGGLRPLDLLASGAGLVGDSLHAATVLGKARLVRPLRPDRPPRALAAVQRWGFTPAGGFAAAAVLYPDAEAIVDERGALTFSELDDRSNRLANALSDAGVLEGDGVGVMCRNHRGFVEALVALSKLGADAMLLNTAFAGPQLTEVVKREKPRAIVYDSEFAELLSDALYRRKGFVAWKDEDEEVSDTTLDELIEGGDPITPLPPDREGRQTILTSGTTGTPKGASRGSPGIGAAVAILEAIPLRGREKVLIAPPLFHQWGFAHFGLAMLTASHDGAAPEVRPGERAGDDRARADRQRPDGAGDAPADPRPRRRRPPRPRHATRCGPFPSAAPRCRATSRSASWTSSARWSTTSTARPRWRGSRSPRPRTCSRRRAPPGARRATPSSRSSATTTAPCKTGETGRIFVSNSMLFEGYTGGGSKDMVGDMMATGDVGHLDEEGRLFVEGRDDDMIVSGGENVFPQEVEETLAKHPKVADAAVIGVDDEKWGQALKAFVVKKGSVSEQALKKHVKDNLAGYKVPQHDRVHRRAPAQPRRQGAQARARGRRRLSTR